MLQLLKETVSSRHSERLEQIVIALIAIEIGAFFVALGSYSILIASSAWHCDHSG
jgi:uncharacterized Rmd1/YagE family protein